MLCMQSLKISDSRLSTRVPIYNIIIVYIYIYAVFSSMQMRPAESPFLLGETDYVRRHDIVFNFI